ncbi:hypothetical protein [Alteromonas confluentis]|uniref:Uncharacterized protein n=1 Tax=Alteromonas confluentis TaxID=1656094 RepID=A0A1E7Z5G9_9ALTE|nr:hypothetical protein [Alteromonas confluentis]OFC68740.1 hypothetical protein BFC18_01430 [Alteromonas confluentis]
MKYKVRNLFWIKLLTSFWLIAGAFAYLETLYVEYLEPDIQQNAVEASFTPKHVDSLNASNDKSVDFAESFWQIANVALFLLTDNFALNPPDWFQEHFLNQSINLISFQYYHSALPA